MTLITLVWVEKRFGRVKNVGNGIQFAKPSCLSHFLAEGLREPSRGLSRLSHFATGQHMAQQERGTSQITLGLRHRFGLGRRHVG